MFDMSTLTRFLRHPYDYMKDGWRFMSPLEKFNTFSGYINFWGRVLQYEIFTKRPNGFVVYTTLFILSFFSPILLVYTLCHYILIGELDNGIKPYCGFGLVVASGSFIWNVTLKDRMKWVPLLEMAGQNIYRNDRKPTAYNRICSECLDKTLKTYIIIVTVTILSFNGALIGPIYTYLQDGTFVTISEQRIPFLQQHPQTEFVINMAWQLYICWFGVPYLFVVEGMIALVNNTITVTSKHNVQELSELSDQMEAGKIGGKQAGEKVTNIFMKIIYMDGYIKRFGDLKFWRLFLAPPALTVGIAISTYAQYVLGHPAGYGFAVCSYVQMAVLCVTGQDVIDRNERLLEALYEFKWYLLPKVYQKDVMHMIHHLQNKEGLKIGPFAQLNYETLKILTQKIYSFLMFLINFET